LLNIASRKLGREDCRIDQAGKWEGISEKIKQVVREDLLLNITNRKLGREGLHNRANRGAGVRNDIGSAP